MKVSKWLLALAMAAVPAAAHAQVLTFEGIPDQTSVGNYYNGGAGGNYGISFSSTSLAIISYDGGGTGNFQGNPSGTEALFFLDGPAATMNVAGGFMTGFSFYYSAVAYAGSIGVWSGLDGTGTLLATLALPITASGPYGTAPCAGTGAYCPWVAIGVGFSGTAQSVNFAGSADYIAFDDVTLNSTTAGGGMATPEPAEMTMLATGLVGLAGFARRKRRA